jgi:hypothetical protein
MRVNEFLTEAERPGLLSRLGSKIASKFGSKSAAGAQETDANFQKGWALYQKWLGQSGMAGKPVPLQDIYDTWQVNGQPDPRMVQAATELGLSATDAVDEKTAKNLMYTYSQLFTSGKPLPAPPPPTPPITPTPPKKKTLKPAPPPPTPPITPTPPKKKTLKPVLHNYRTLASYIKKTLTPAQSQRILIGLGAMRPPKKPLKFKVEEQDIIDKINHLPVKQRDLVIQTLTDKYMTSSVPESLKHDLQNKYHQFINEA